MGSTGQNREEGMPIVTRLSLLKTVNSARVTNIYGEYIKLFLTKIFMFVRFSVMQQWIILIRQQRELETKQIEQAN